MDKQLDILLKLLQKMQNQQETNKQKRDGAGWSLKAGWQSAVKGVLLRQFRFFLS